MLFVVLLILNFGLSDGAALDLTKVKECNGVLDYRQLTDKREDELQFYMQTTAKNDQECVHMCYERLHFCYTAMYKPRVDTSNADGICMFGYYRPDSCLEETSDTNAANTISKASTHNGKGATSVGGEAKIFTCIICRENPPSFVQDEDQNRVAPAQLIKPANTATKPPTPTTPSTNATENNGTASPLSNVMFLKQSKAFSYLMPKCPNTLKYSVQPIMLTSKPKVYAATGEIRSVYDCAHFCFRQHFCTAAFFYNDNCLLSYQSSPNCDLNVNITLPTDHHGVVLITCLSCHH